MSNKEELYKLPDNWIWTTIGEIAILSSGGTPSRANSGYFRGSIPWVKSGELNYNIITDTEEKITQEALDSSSAKIIPSKSLLIALYGSTVGKIAILGIDASTNQAVASITNFTNFNQYFLFYYLLHNREKLLQKRKGGAQPNISQKILSEFYFPLPPLNEQNRIVFNIEHLFSELEQAEKVLKKASHQLKLYRQTLLKSAFEGKLTKIWRDQNKPKSAEALRTMIITQRQNLYKKELVAWQDSYKTWENENKKNKKPLKPKELVFPAEIEKTDMKDLHELPIGVIWTKVGFLASIEMGQSPAGDSYNNTGNGTQLINGPVEFGSTPFSKTLAVKWTTKPTKLCTKDDLILCVRGSTTGKMNIANDIACIGRGVCSIKSEGVLQEYINHFFNYSNKKILEMGTGSTFPSISKEQILNFIIPLFSIEEQKEIITNIESRLTIIESLEKTVKNTIYNCEVFRYSILKKAFEGKLVSQDFNDEPANELLHKIKREKSNFLKAQKKSENLKPKIKRQMETKKTVFEILKESKDPISTQEIWEKSIHDGDIEGFYSEIKKIYNELTEVKGEMESFLSIRE